MRLVALGSLAAASMLLSACATITRGSSQDFVVESTPSEAEAKLSTGQTCTTPCTLRMKRKSKFVVTVSKEGYQTQEVHVHGKVKEGGGAGFVGNAIFGGLIGAGVDAASGAALSLSPNPVKVELVPAGSAAPAVAAPAITAPAAEPAPAPAAEPAPGGQTGNE